MLSRLVPVNASIGKRPFLKLRQKRNGRALPWSASNGVPLVPSSARAGTEGRARGEGAGAHTEARAEGRRNVAKEFAAAGAAAFASKRSGGIGAEPMTAGFAQRIDTLNREAGQILHFLSPEAAKLRGIEVRPTAGGT